MGKYNVKQRGLTEKEAQENLARFGPNRLPEPPPPSDLKILLLQLKSPLIYILLFAGLVTIFLKDFTDTAVIFAAVFINTILGFYQERKAERALLALKKVLTPHAKVIREGKLKIIEAHLLVPQDLVILSSGDKVPADGVLVEAVNLSVNEAVLTGESMPVKKEKVELKRALGPFFPIRHSLLLEEKGSFDPLSKIKDSAKVFMGTTVVLGRGKMIVTRTGEKTEIGKIATTLKTLEEEKTPLQKRISSLAHFLALLISGICLLIFLTGIFLGKSALAMFTTAVAIAVAAIPEGMAVSLTVILAIGMQRILKRKALVRRLLAAETLGSVTVIATDKTGTLTEGKLRVVKTSFTNKKRAWLASVLVNNQADPLEVALWQWAREESKIGDPQKIVEENPRLFELPFDPEKRYQLVVVRMQAAEVARQNFLRCLTAPRQLVDRSVAPRKLAGSPPPLVVFISGAPEVVLAKCKLDKEEKEKWMERIRGWGKEGLRMIGLGEKILRKSDSAILHRIGEKEERELRWLGLVGFEDPPREEVAEVVKVCQEAGIKVKLLTGDFAPTALAVWKKLNKRPLSSIRFFNGEEVEKMSFAQLKEEVKRVDVFTRVTPGQKLKIVEALKENGEVVALVGDGVNDALALKRADIGIVVGEACDVAKETADMVLLDSNFKTIVAAIEEGRGIFANIKKVVLYLLSDSFSEVFLVLGSLIFGLPLPLTAAQILYINLLTDGFPDLALTVEPKEKGLLKRKPVEKKAPLLDQEGRFLVGLISLVTAVACFLIFSFFLKRTGLLMARTITFVALGIDSLFYVFSVKSLKKSILKIDLFANPYLLGAVFLGIFLQVLPLYHPFLRSFLKTAPLDLSQWGVVLTICIFVIILIEGVKKIWRDR